MAIRTRLAAGEVSRVRLPKWIRPGDEGSSGARVAPVPCWRVSRPLGGGAALRVRAGPVAAWVALCCVALEVLPRAGPSQTESGEGHCL